MLEVDCNCAFVVTCGQKSKLNMLPHPGCFNIHPCTACGEKCLSHTKAEAEKQAKHKKQSEPQAVLWHTKTRHTNIKLITQAFIEVGHEKIFIEKREKAP